jgi:DNA invertase Pin-like site-specific DNA recombinase
VTIIPATRNKFSKLPVISNVKRKAAAYARVSTDNEEQLTSYNAQVDYYTSYIKSKKDWELVKIYTDEGISATNTRKRDGFKQMINDALAGKIDLIVTKSVSRFARNTVDSLITVRKLKDKGIEIYFEKENIWTLDSKGELLITIMSSLAQEESRSISENVTWGKRKSFSDGNISLPYKHFLGYEKGEDGFPKPVKSEAEIIKLIYKLFLEGKSTNAITKILENMKIKSPSGKENWCPSTVRNILHNEKYKGSAILHKKFTVDFLSKRQKINEGEVPQYYIENSHERIISPEIFDLVQIEIKNRKIRKKYTSSLSCFSGKVICGECGNFYGSKVWHSTSKYRRTIWQCNHKFKNEKKCKTPHLTEKQLKEIFMKAFNKIVENKVQIIKDCKILLLEIYDTSKIFDGVETHIKTHTENQTETLRTLESSLEASGISSNISNNTTKINDEISKIEIEIQNITHLIESMIEKNAGTAQNQEEYKRNYEIQVKKYEDLKEKLENLENQKLEKKAEKRQIEEFLKNLEDKEEPVTEFDEELWFAMAEGIMVKSKDEAVVKFKNWREIEIKY